MKKKFKIMYPEDYWNKDLAGKPYRPPTGSMVVMNGGGVFFQVTRGYYASITKLSEILPKYDVVWK